MISMDLMDVTDIEIGAVEKTRLAGRAIYYRTIEFTVDGESVVITMHGKSTLLRRLRMRKV